MQPPTPPWHGVRPDGLDLSVSLGRETDLLQRGVHRGFNPRAKWRILDVSGKNLLGELRLPWQPRRARTYAECPGGWPRPHRRRGAGSELRKFSWAVGQSPSSIIIRDKSVGIGCVDPKTLRSRATCEQKPEQATVRSPCLATDSKAPPKACLRPTEDKKQGGEKTSPPRYQ